MNFPCRESNPGHDGENARSSPLDHMGSSQAFSIFPLFSEKISKDSLEFIRSGHSCSVQSDSFKGYGYEEYPEIF